MEIYDKLLKPIKETSYLSAMNVERYRVIIRFFYQEHEKIHYWMHKEEVYAMMKTLDCFSEYTMENCQNDLAALVEWGNLIASQDTAKVYTVEDFKNKKYRYQLSEYTVVIERMTMELENLEIEGASLEPTLLERIRTQILMLENMKEKSNVEVAGWWRSLNNDFMRLNQDYQDYLKTLNSAKAEQLMKSREFLLFKDKLITYLQTFVKLLQEHGVIIEGYLQGVQMQDVEVLFDKIIAYEKDIPRIDHDFNEEKTRDMMMGRWMSLYNWFLGDGEHNEIDRLFEITDEIIRKITRYALQIGELHNQGANKKEEYRKIASIFEQCESLEQAHRLSAYIFGVDTCMHLKNITDRDTDSIHSGVYNEAPTFIELEAKTRGVRKKAERIPAKDYTLERQIQRLELEEQRHQQQKKIAALIQNGEIVFSTLPLIDAQVRKVLLGWVSRALSNKDRSSRNDQGEIFYVETEKKGNCILHCEDGDLQMPCFKIVFK